MIRKLWLENFQGFQGKQSVDFSNITLIFGPNASGKTSIIRALQVLKQTFESDSVLLQLSGTELDLGSRENATFGNMGESQLMLGVSVDLPEKTFQETGLSEFGMKIRNGQVDFLLQFEFGTPGIPQEAQLAWFCHGEPGLNEESKIPGDFYFEKGAREVLERQFQAFEDKLGLPRDGEEFRSRNWLDQDDPAHEFTGEVEGLFSFDLGMELEEDNEAVWLNLRMRRLEDLVNAGLYHLRSALENLSFGLPVREINTELERKFFSKSLYPLEAINDILSSLTAHRYQIKVQQSSPEGMQSFERVIYDRYLGVQVGFENVGQGLSQIIPIIESLASQSLAPNSVSIIQQPETHLHPKMQADFGDELSKIANASGQVIVETHSESILLRLQKRLRENALQGSKVSIIYCETPEPEYSVSQARELGFTFPDQSLGANFRHSELLTFAESKELSELMGSSRVAALPRLTNVMTNLRLENSGDLLDPLPISFANLRVQDLL